MKYRGVIFDLDGVIVSTDDCHYQAWQRLADEEGISFNREINERLRGVSRMESLEIILERATGRYSLFAKHELCARKNGYYQQFISSLTPSDLLPGVSNFLKFISQAGCKTAIGSSSKNAGFILQRIGLATSFNAVVDGNHIQNSKPHPEVFLRAAQNLNLDPSACLVIEDADAGIEAALAAGIDVLGVGSARNHPRATYSAVGLDDPLAYQCLRRTRSSGTSVTR